MKQLFILTLLCLSFAIVNGQSTYDSPELQRQKADARAHYYDTTFAVLLCWPDIDTASPKPVYIDTSNKTSIAVYAMDFRPKVQWTENGKPVRSPGNHAFTVAGWLTHNGDQAFTYDRKDEIKNFIVLKDFAHHNQLMFSK